MERDRLIDSVAQTAFRVSAVVIVVGGAFLGGLYALYYRLAPATFVLSMHQQIAELIAPSDEILVSENLRYDSPIETLLPEAVAPGLVLVSGDIKPRETAVRIMDRAGRVVQEWRTRWADVWGPDEGAFTAGRRPVEGMYLHGIAMLPDGDIVANFEHLSTVRFNACGEVVWKLDNLGHHSVHDNGDGTLWVSAETLALSNPTGYANHRAPIKDWTIQKIDAADGTILRNVHVLDILRDNDLGGLMLVGARDGEEPVVSGDTLHLNDVESFPAGMTPGVFGPGDLALSLRNVNTILVIDEETLAVKFQSTGRVLRQHDVDFLSGDRLSVFDNNNLIPDWTDAKSRIVEFDGRTGEMEIALDGEGEVPFFTQIMGVHERLPNGNILVVESGDGRVYEFTPDGRLAWRYSNRWTETQNLRVFGSLVLPGYMDAAFFENARRRCGG